MKCEQCLKPSADGTYVRNRGKTVCMGCFEAGGEVREACDQLAAMYENAARAMETQAQLMRSKAESIRRNERTV